MKTKDIIGIIFAVVLISGVGFVFYSTQVPHKPNAAALSAKQAEVVPVISDKLDGGNTLPAMITTYHVRDYKLPVDLSAGLGNTNPFGQ
jgi:hypothetical protein